MNFKRQVRGKHANLAGGRIRRIALMREWRSQDTRDSALAKGAGRKGIGFQADSLVSTDFGGA